MADIIYFTVGENPASNYAAEIWKYDGVNSPTHVGDLNVNCNRFGNDPTIMGTFAGNGKIYIVTQNYEVSSTYGYTLCDGVTPVPPSIFVNGANSIYELDPVTDTITHVLDYNYADGSPYNDLVPACAMYDDGTVIYIAHQCWGNTDWHLIRFDPLAQTTTLVFGPYDASTYYISPSGLQDQTAQSPGFIAHVGGLLYYANGSQVFSSATGALGTWTLVDHVGVYNGDGTHGDAANWVSRPDISVGLISKGDYDDNGDYWFPATNTTSAHLTSPWYPHNLWNLSVFKISAATGNITLEYQNLDDGLGIGGSDLSLYGYQAEQIIDRNGILTAINDGIDTFSQPIVPYSPLPSSGYIIDNSVGWNPVGQIPYAVYLAQNYQASSGPIAACMFGVDTFIISAYSDTVGSAGFGIQLIRQDAGGAWSIIQQWAGFSALFNDRGQTLSIVVASSPPPPPPPPIPITIQPCAPLTAFVRTWISLSDTSGNVVAVFDDWKTLDITHTLNSYSVATLTMDNLDPRTQLFALDSIIEVWRSIGTFKYVEYVGFHRVGQQKLTEDQHAIFSSTSRGLLDLVHRRFVLYPTVTAYTLKSAPGETVIKQIVNENVGPGAFNPPRYQSGITPGFTLQPDTAQGVVWSGQIANDNVLKVIGDISTLSSVDYDVIRTSPITFEFRTYYPQRGVDRSAYLAFAPELGNMVAPDYTLANDEEVNVFAVLGPGQDTSRRVLPVLGTDLGASPWNQVEGTVSDASSDSTYESMLAAGQTAIANAAPKETFAFDVLQVDNAAYGRDYIVGDYVTARFGTISRRKKIIGATVGIKEGVETIKLTFSDLP